MATISTVHNDISPRACTRRESLTGVENQKAKQEFVNKFKSAFDANPALASDHLKKMGIDVSRYVSVMDELAGNITTPSIGTPIQFLQAWLPGFVYIKTAARKIDSLIGMRTVGQWSDEEVVQGALERSGSARQYGDYTNIPFTGWNTNFERATVVRFEQGLKIGALEEARAAEMQVNAANAKREAASLELEISRNLVGFYGFNSGLNLTYGFLNIPTLPAYVTVATGGSGFTEWSTKTYLEITADIRTAFAALRTQSQELVNPEDLEITLALPTDAVDYLGVVSDFGNSVRDWLTATYPKCRVVSAPQLNDANGGDGVFYLYAESVEDESTDGGEVFLQLVPTKFTALGVEKTSKGYIEDYSNATAGVMLKRPYGVVRFSGI